MGYRVEYGQTECAPGGRRRFSWTIFAFLLFLAGTALLWPRGRAVLTDILFPGDAAVTAAALEDLARELEAGARVRDALESFCRTVFQGAGLGLG